MVIFSNYCLIQIFFKNILKYCTMYLSVSVYWAWICLGLLKNYICRSVLSISTDMDTFSHGLHIMSSSFLTIHYHKDIFFSWRLYTLIWNQNLQNTRNGSILRGSCILRYIFIFVDDLMWWSFLGYLTS